MGTWYTEEGEDSRLDYTIILRKSGLTVRTFDYIDWKREIITRVKWDGQVLQFHSQRPGRIGQIQVRSLSKDQAEFVFTFTEREILKKKTE